MPLSSRQSFNNTNYSLYYDLQQSEKITMEPCPVGFGPLNETCDCEKQLHKIENIKCIAANNTITQPGDNWISSINDCAVAFSPCPFDYCKTAQVNFHLTYLNNTGIEYEPSDATNGDSQVENLMWRMLPDRTTATCSGNDQNNCIKHCRHFMQLLDPRSRL